MTQSTRGLLRWCVRVSPRESGLDGHARDVLADIHELGMTHIEGVRFSKLYFLSGSLVQTEVRELSTTLLTDPIAERSSITEGFAARTDCFAAIEVQVKPGVMNPVAMSTLDAVGRMIGPKIDAVQTGRRYEIIGAKSADELERIARKVLANDCMEAVYIDGFDRHDPLPTAPPVPPERPFDLHRVKLAGLGDEALTRLSRTAHLFLSLDEMTAIRDHFAERGRDPTDLELETLAQTWSEHCVHKTFKSAVQYDGEGFGAPGTVSVRFENLLADTIARTTRDLDRPWCLSVFEDNAGIVAFDDDYGIAFKAETHNHPSAIEPYGGAATGIGGCIRDIMGCGLGAKPIASTDVFCLAPPDFDDARLPKDVLHPRRVLGGVVRGVRDYGNRMGIPTVGGAIYFDERYLANPLVFCGSVGLIPRNRIRKAARPGDRIVVAGGRTGRDGIHGATFSSAELTDHHADEFAHAVQIGHAIEEKKVLDALLLARDHERGCLYSAITDCGAGGLSSAVGEMGEQTGAEVDIEHVPLKYAGLRYDEIWISEAQERMVFAVPPEKLDAFLAVFRLEEVEATVIGTFTDDRTLTVRYRGETVGRLDMAFLHHGLPRQVREATWTRKVSGETGGRLPETCDALLEALGSYNVGSKEWVIRQYDHEVQGRSVIKPLAGPGGGPSDAAVVRPVYDRLGAVAIGCGLCPHLSEIDPYRMAIAAVDEALRNVVCVGADPSRTAVLDNFCWGKVDTPEAMGGLVRACKGAADAAMAYGLPFISGKDSLNNEFTQNAEDAARLGLPATMSIPGTLLISALGGIEDARRCISMDLKTPGDVLVLASDPVDRVGFEYAFDLHEDVADLIADGKVRAAHDVSDGGLAVTIAEMCIASGYGARVDIADGVYDESLLAEIPTTYLVEMNKADAQRSGHPIIGEIIAEGSLTIARNGQEIIRCTVADLAEAWRSPLVRGGVH